MCSSLLRSLPRLPHSGEIPAWDREEATKGPCRRSIRAEPSTKQRGLCSQPQKGICVSKAPQTLDPETGLVFCPPHLGWLIGRCVDADNGTMRTDLRKQGWALSAPCITWVVVIRLPDTSMQTALHHAMSAIETDVHVGKATSTGAMAMACFPPVSIISYIRGCWWFRGSVIVIWPSTMRSAHLTYMHAPQHPHTICRARQT